jgi:hypothetical protein
MEPPRIVEPAVDGEVVVGVVTPGVVHAAVTAASRSDHERVFKQDHRTAEYRHDQSFGVQIWRPG